MRKHKTIDDPLSAKLDCSNSRDPRHQLPSPSSIQLPRKSALGSQRCIIQFGTCGYDHATLASELEIGRRVADVNLAEELPARVEDLHPIAGGHIHIAFGIDMDSIWNLGRDEGEDFSVLKRPVLFHIIAITIRVPGQQLVSELLPMLTYRTWEGAKALTRSTDCPHFDRLALEVHPSLRCICAVRLARRRALVMKGRLSSRVHRSPAGF